jgi:hypothetical protein
MQSDRVCLTSAPDATPLALDRRYEFLDSLFHTNWPVADQPHLAVSDDKIGITLDDFASPITTHTLVLAMAEVAAGQPAGALHHAVVDHGGRVRLATSISPETHLFWTRVGADQTIQIGRIRGVPGAGGITTESVAKTYAGSTNQTAAVVDGGRLITATEVNRQAVTFAVFDQLDGPFAPHTGQHATVSIPPLKTDNHACLPVECNGPCPLFGAVVQQLSLSMTRRGAVMLGFVSGAAPYLVTWNLASNAITGPGVLDTYLYQSDECRRDFVPVGAAFADALHPGATFAGVGWGDGTSVWWNGFSFGQHALYLRDTDQLAAAAAPAATTDESAITDAPASPPLPDDGLIPSHREVSP